ncbi:DUF2384 domain-containing protein [Alcanivorax sp. S6407]|uniref:antitoxin Xre/MbcA/ParS toxin-binding domain-containing protein n=1 Tax=Alcanivorax sp. S6407 TaxID=2926424 RepID=UPI001FF2CDC1|nr:antitoxin Xre/MbcA/ParS toxin-binding domain-containing protein [Alcanivorax sp. S6407]MCK0152479.1 DUF2384 domain-containing protein [Alcanivorax sp. S6407]
MTLNTGSYFRHPEESAYATIRRALVHNSGVPLARFKKVANSMTPLNIYSWLVDKQNMGTSLFPFSDEAPRQCPICAKSLFHTEYYSLPWLTRCPIHNIPFEEKCPDCGKYWPNIKSLPRNPCPTCGIPSIDDMDEDSISERDRIRRFSFADLRSIAEHQQQDGAYRLVFYDNRVIPREYTCPSWSLSNIADAITPAWDLMSSPGKPPAPYIDYIPIKSKTGPVVQIDSKGVPFGYWVIAGMSGFPGGTIEPKRSHVTEDCKTLLKIIDWIFTNTDHEECRIGNYRGHSWDDGICPICGALSLVVNSLSDDRFSIGVDLNNYPLLDRYYFPEMNYSPPLISHNDSLYKFGYRMARYYRSMAIEQVFCDLLRYLTLIRDADYKLVLKNYRPNHVKSLPNVPPVTTQKIKISIQNGRMSIYTDFNSPLDQIDLESMKPSNEWCQSHNAYSLRPFVMVKGCSIIIEKNAIPSIESFADWYREQFDNSNSLRNYYTSLQGMKDAQKWRNIMEKKLRNDQVWPLLDLPINSKERENLVLSGLDASIITRMADLIRVEDDKIVSVLHSDKTSKSIPTKGTGLSPAEGEAIIRIANNLITALDVFDGNKNEAVTWLSTPRRIFNGSSPLEMCKTSHDAEQVRILLLRAKHGVFS